MDEKSPKTQEPEVKIAAPPKGAAAEQYCPICGRDAGDPALFRFGEYFCSEAHVAEFAAEIRRHRAVGPEAAPGAVSTAVALRPSLRGGIWGLLKTGALCAGGALVLFALIPLVWSSGGALAGAGLSLLSIAALLACPLGMYFMMRGMQRMEHGGKEPAAASPGTQGKTEKASDDAAR